MCIKAISISVMGTPSSDITSCGAPSDVLTHVTSGDAGVAFTIDITVPALWGDTHEIIEVHNHSYEDHTKGLRIIVDHDITGDCNINTYAELLLRSFIINLQRRITFNTGTSVSSGYNTLFRYNTNAKQPMQVDSVEPYSDYNEFVMRENRYKILDKVNPNNKDILINKSKQDALTRRKSYLSKTKNTKNN